MSLENALAKDNMTRMVGVEERPGRTQASQPQQKPPGQLFLNSPKVLENIMIGMSANMDVSISGAAFRAEFPQRMFRMS